MTRPTLRTQSFARAGGVLIAVLVLGGAFPAGAAEPADGTILLANYSGFDLDAAASDNAAAAAVAPDGKLVIAGWASDGANRWVLVAQRFLTNSILDTSFGSGGSVVNPTGHGGSSWGRATAVLADGSVLIGGTFDWGSGNSDFLVVKLTPSGAVDTSFGTAFGGGFSVIPFDVGDDLTDEGNALALDRSGRILLAGSIDVAPGNRDIGVVRLRADGYLDTSFGNGGRVEIPFDYSGPGIDLGFGVAVAPSGRIAVGGATRYQPGGGTTSFNFAVAQLLADGTLDASFGDGGRQIAAFDVGGTLNDIVRAVAVDEHNRILVGGEVAYAPGVWVYGVARFLSNGVPDSSFNGSGHRLDGFSCTFLCGDRDSVHSIALQGDGKIVLAGPTYADTTGNSNFGVARLLDDGGLDTSFGIGGRFHHDWTHGGNDDDYAEAAVVGADGRILVAGTIEYSFPDMDWGHLTLANHYIFADGFEGGYLRHWSSHVQ